MENGTRSDDEIRMIKVISEFLRDRDENLLPEEADDEERTASAEWLIDLFQKALDKRSAEGAAQ